MKKYYFHLVSDTSYKKVMLAQIVLPTSHILSHCNNYGKKFMWWILVQILAPASQWQYQTIGSDQVQDLAA